MLRAPIALGHRYALHARGGEPGHAAPESSERVRCSADAFVARARSCLAFDPGLERRLRSVLAERMSIPVAWLDTERVLAELGRLVERGTLELHRTRPPRLPNMRSPRSQGTPEVMAEGPVAASSPSFSAPAGVRGQIRSFADAEARLAEARARLRERRAAGLPAYVPKYSDDQLLEMAKTGTPAGERFLVSIQPKGSSTLAFQRDSGLVPTWVTTLDQIENADTDPLLLHQILGAESNFDPNKTYIMHVIDRGENIDGFGKETIIPTYDKLCEACTRHLAHRDPEKLRTVLTPVYGRTYARDIGQFKQHGLNEFNSDDITAYAAQLPPAERELFDTRHLVRREIGANYQFTGNGLTQNTAPGGGKYGVVEALTLERNAPPVADLHRQGVVRTFDLSPL
jgi:hypothetical protein